MTLRLYGNAPYTVAALHGGPGAAGSVGYLASELSKRAKTGVLEPVQSAESIEGQVAELSDLLAEFNPKVLMGHSWGGGMAGAVLRGKISQRIKADFDRLSAV